MRNRLIGARLAILAILVAGTVAFALASATHGSTGRAVSSADTPRALAEPPLAVFLPAISNRFPLSSAFGMSINSLGNGELEWSVGAGAHWVRGIVVRWPVVEPSKGSRDWGALADVEQELITAASHGMQVILLVVDTPDWARESADIRCAPVKAEELPAFASFVSDLVARYGVEPYRVKYWELFNEPDVAPGLVGPSAAWDCWGNAADPYYGGGRYAAMLKTVYPQIKAVDPQAEVLVGGLLLDCDPRSPGTCLGPDGDKPPRFLEGILRVSGGEFFDGISFHAYDYYAGQQDRYGNANWLSSSGTSGPVGVAKARYIRELLAKYGVSGKYLVNTESAILCDVGCDAAFEATKADYVAQLYSAAIADGLRANVWYSMTGWRNSGLVATNGTTLPAYTAFQTARAELEGATFTRALNSFPGLKGYEFERGDRRVWVLWSLDGSDHSVVLSSAPLAVFDALGSGVPSSSTIVVGPKPLYLEWTR